MHIYSWYTRLENENVVKCPFWGVRGCSEQAGGVFYGIGAGFFFFCVGKARPSPFNPSGFRQRGSLKSRLNLLFQMMWEQCFAISEHLVSTFRLLLLDKPRVRCKTDSFRFIPQVPSAATKIFKIFNAFRVKLIKYHPLHCSF